jgi:hypothetical protein
MQTAMTVTELPVILVTDEDYPELPDCPACDGYSEPLGTLGRTMHLRCRFCGCQWTQSAD